MGLLFKIWLCVSVLAVCSYGARPTSATSTPGLIWDAAAGRASADLQDKPLRDVLEAIAKGSGWRIYVEPGLNPTISAKFDRMSTSQALTFLLGRLNYALVPSEKGPPRLFVFRTSREQATQLVQAVKVAELSRRVPNELIVRLKPGADIQEIAKKLGARVVGKIDGQNAYRLEFDDEDAVTSARTGLSENSEVSSVDDNFYVDRPPTPQQAPFSAVPPVSLQLRSPPSDGRVIIGLVDTGVQKLGGNLDAFLLESISVAGKAVLDPQSPSHGTSMAETVLRSLQYATKGSTSVQILPVDVYGASSTTTTFDVAAGIVAARNGGATVINLSLGSPSDSAFLKSLVQELAAQKVPIFAAAGNEPVIAPFYPAAYPEVTAVTATDRGVIADYANRGSFVDVAAPGTSVVYFNDRPYYIVGTSAASAYTAGLAAGYLETSKSGTDTLQEYLKSNLGVRKAD